MKANPAPIKSGVFLALALILCGCSGTSGKQAKTGDILIVGDSLTAGYGLDDPDTEAWPALIQATWESDGFFTGQRIINAGISGDTSGGGMKRLPALLEEYQPTTVVIALGSNDIRQQVTARAIERNLDQMVQLSQATGATVLLVGVDLPRPLSMAARGQPNASIQQVAKRHNLEMAAIPLDDIFRDGNMLSDQIHPARAGQTTIQDALEPAIRKAAAR